MLPTVPTKIVLNSYVSLSRNQQKHKRAKPFNMHNVVQHKGHNFSMCPLASISSKSTQLSCSHLPQMHSWSIPASSSKLPKHMQHLSLSISSSALSFLTFFCAGLDDKTVLSDFLLACPFPFVPCLDCLSCSLASLVAAFAFYFSLFLVLFHCSFFLSSLLFFN